MRLSPEYLRFMVESGGFLIVKALYRGITAVESNALILIALYMTNDPEAHTEFKTILSEKGDLVSEIWHNLYTAVDANNKAGRKSANVNIIDVLERMKNENRG